MREALTCSKKEDVPSTQGLKIIIIGCGKVGRTLVEQLSQEGHDITIIDKNREKDLTAG